MTELKPCPSCGETENLVRDDYEGVVGCQACGMQARGHSIATGTGDIGFALYAWNHRPLEDALSARVKELEDKLAEVDTCFKAAMLDWAEENEESTIRLYLFRKEKARADALEAELAKSLVEVAKWKGLCEEFRDDILPYCDKFKALAEAAIDRCGKLEDELAEARTAAEKLVDIMSYTDSNVCPVCPARSSICITSSCREALLTWAYLPTPPEEARE